VDYIKSRNPENYEEGDDCGWCVGTVVRPYEIGGGPGVHSGPGTGGDFVGALSLLDLAGTIAHEIVRISNDAEHRQLADRLLAELGGGAGREPVLHLNMADSDTRFNAVPLLGRCQFHVATDRHGQQQNAVLFERGEYYELKNDPALHLSRFTISVWLQPTAKDSEIHVIYSKDDGSRGVQLFLMGDSVYFGIGDGRSWDNLAASHTWRDGRWHHLAAVYDGKRLRLYGDGRELESKKHRTDPVYGDRLPQVGRNGYTKQQPYLGFMDELSIYGVPLPASEIAALAK